MSVDPMAADMQNGWNFNRYNYAANNPYRFKDPDGRVIETVWDAGNVVMGVVSAYDNFSSGNTGDGWVDVAGVVVDVAATVVPFVPGGAGTAIKAGRAADRIADTSRAARREAQREAGVPTSRPATSQSGKEGQRQLIVEGADGKPKAVTQHSADKDHANPHWHAADAKTDPVSGEVRTNRHGQAKYESGGPAVEYREKRDP
ncbi:MAG: hypothetical protein LPJ91_10030 [Pseudazoarcus pumilus]|nr:hypothetical protein [Pseudazoarcus pumilus]